MSAFGAPGASEPMRPKSLYSLTRIEGRYSAYAKAGKHFDGNLFIRVVYHLAPDTHVRRIMFALKMMIEMKPHGMNQPRNDVIRRGWALRIESQISRSFAATHRAPLRKAARVWLTRDGNMHHRV